METQSINLNTYRTHGARIFSGRDRGKQVREESRLDEIVSSTTDIIEIVVPEDTITINPSFLEEFFKNVVKLLGKENFYSRFKFINNGEYQIKPNLETAIERILRKRNALN